MKRTYAIMIAFILSSWVQVHGDELVFRASKGLVTYVKKNIRLLDTVSVSGVPTLRYSALEGAAQLPVADVIEIRFIPYDLAEISSTQLVPDTVAVPLKLLSSSTIPKSVTVSSIAALKTSLADNTVDEIVVKNGRYIVSPAGNQASNSLWIGSAYASRTRPILIRAETRGAVTFDGNGITYFGGITFTGGAHDQTWDGFNFTNGTPTYTGVIMVGGYVNGTDANPAHHITMRYISIYGCWGVSKTASDRTNDHAIYVSYASQGVHDILFDNFSIDDRTNLGLSTAIVFYHSDPANGYYNAKNFTVSNMTVRGTQQAIQVWDETLQNITVTDTVIKNALLYAVRYETVGSTGIVFKNIVSTGSGSAGFYSNQGANPPGVTLINNSFK